MPQYTPPSPINTQSALNLSADTVVKATPGIIYSINVTTAGSTTGAFYDTTATGSVGAENLVAVVPEDVGTYPFGPGFQTANGIVFVPGTDMVASIAFS